MKQGYTESSWAAFAGIRFLLAAIVLTSHLQSASLLPAQLPFLPAMGGRAAVLGFLLISGISIGHSYAQQPNGYSQRRFLRIYPLYFFSVLLTEVLTLLIGPVYKLQNTLLVAAGWKTFVANIFLLQGFITIPITYNGPLWSLGAECFYYVLVPWLAKLRLTTIVILVISSMIAFLFYPKPWLYGYMALRYAWPWLIGFLISTHYRPKLIVVLLSVGILITALNKADTPEGLSWLTFGAVAAIAFLLKNSKFTIPKASKTAFNFLGEISYPLYLFHMPLYIFLYSILNIRNSWAFIVLIVLFAITLNYLLDHRLKQVFWKPATNWLVSKLRKSLVYWQKEVSPS